MRRLVALGAFTLLAFAGPLAAVGQEAFAPRVAVLRVLADGSEEPLGGVTVQLHAVEEGVGLVESVEGVTGSDGTVGFELAPELGTRYLAEVDEDGFRFQSADILTPGSTDDTVVRVYSRTHDASAVRASSLITTVQAHESFLTFEQLWMLETDRPVVYTPPDEETEGIELRLPSGVQGIVVDRPDPEGGTVLAGDTGVVFRGQVGPPGALLKDDFDVVLRFSLPNTSSTYRYEQPLPMAVGHAVVAVPLETSFSQAPRLDVELLVPPCGVRGTNDLVCFPEQGGGVAGWNPFPHDDRRLARGGTSDAAATLLFETRGWPTPPAGFQWLTAAAAATVIVLGGLHWWRVRERAPSRAIRSRTDTRQLERRRRRLLADLLQAHEAHESGELPRSELELQDLLIRYQLDGVYAELEGE